MDSKVLVIEDDLEINELLGEYLALEHIDYVQAATGAAGLRVAAAQHPDAVILDLMLPDMNGFDVARKLSTHRATFDIPVVILSCMCQDCDKEKGYANGALFYMTKPFLPDKLLETVANALGWKSLLKTRVPRGEVLLGRSAAPMECSRALNQMIADLFARTELSDEAVGQIREAMEMLDGWAREWQAQHKDAPALKVAYQITDAVDGADAAGTVEWVLSEETPGLLADAFFKARPAEGRFSGGLTGGLKGLGATLTGRASATPSAVPLPERWRQVLSMTGAGRFEKDPLSRTVRLSRPTANMLNVEPSSTGSVPMVEMERDRAVSRERDGALAGS